jgi:hypothetical protein
MKDVFELEPNTHIPHNSYIVSYPYILAYFEGLKVFSERAFVCGAHIAYGWMPTVLDLNPDKLPVGLQRGAELLTEAKTNGRLVDADIELLAKLVNNSLVGASKLLHFTAPDAFAIWDSKIYSFVFEEAAHNYRVNRLGKYREYMSKLEQIKRQPGFEAFHKSVRSKVGYEVGSFRAIELIMFLNVSRGNG